MADTSKQIIKQFGVSLTEDIKKAIPSATGKTAESVRIEFTNSGFIIYGGSQIGAIIDGRKPTGPNAKKGNPTVQQQILSWIRAKSIRPREADMTIESLSFAIAQHIHKNGYPGKGNIFANVITKDRIDSLTKTLLKNQLFIIDSDVIKNTRKI